MCPGWLHEPFCGLNYRIQGQFFKLASFEWLGGSSVNLKRSVTRVARRLASRVDCRAAEPLSYIYLSRSLNTQCDWRAVEPPSHKIIYLTRSQNYIPYSFFKNLTRLARCRATEPLNYRPYSFFKHLTRLASRRAAEPLNYRPYSFFKHLTRLASRRAAEPLNYRPYSFFSLNATGEPPSH